MLSKRPGTMDLLGEGDDYEFAILKKYTKLADFYEGNSQCFNTRAEQSCRTQ